MKRGIIYILAGVLLLSVLFSGCSGSKTISDDIYTPDVVEDTPTPTPPMSTTPTPAVVEPTLTVDEPTQTPTKSFVEVVTPKYIEVGDFSEGMAYVMRSGDYKYGFIDTTGSEVVPLQYDNKTSNFSDGVAWVTVSGVGSHIVDKKGNEVFPMYGDKNRSDFTNGAAVVYDNDSGWGVIDKLGNAVVPFGKYTGIYRYTDGLAAVVSGNQYGYIDATGKEIVPLGTYDYSREYRLFADTSQFHKGMAVVENQGVYGCIDTTGAEIVPLGKYAHIVAHYAHFDGSRIVAAENGKMGLIDCTGREIIPTMYRSVNWCGDGVAKTRILDADTDKEEFINFTTGEAIPSMLQYEQVNIFQNGLAAVKLNGKWGYVDTFGNEVIEPVYENANNFSNGYATVVIKSAETGKYERGVIDTNGNIVVPFGLYDDIRDFIDGFAAVKRDNAWGFISIATQ